MKEQEAFEDSLFQLFYKMATIGGGPNEEQMKILDMYKLTFGLTDERIANVITEFKKEEKVTREINYKDVFAKIRSELSNMYMTSKDLINNLVVAFERPYLIKNDLNAPKNIITIFTNESELLLELVNVISSMMTEELVIKAGVSRFDCAQYSKDENYVEFANNFIHLLNDQEEVIVIENFKALSSKNTAFLVDLLKNNFTYVDTNDGRAKISCNNKYFVFISMGEPRDFGAIVGDSVFSKIGDVIEVKDFSDEEITRMVANYTNYFVVSCRSELELSLYYDEGLIDFLKQFYSKNIGMRSIKYYIEQNIHKPLVDYKLKMQPTNEQQLTLVVVENEVAVYDEKNVIKLSKFAQKKTNETLEEVKAELNSIIGLNEVKEYVLKLEDNVVARKMREEAGFKNSSISMNMIFTGNPGTGKTTIARIVAEYLKALGVLEKGQLVEVTRGDLVGEHVGETAAKTTAKISSALGGVLFIDEAYSLSRDKNDTFGLEAIDTLVKMMEDNKDNLVVILAGYKAEMEHFLKSNSGLKSRFPNFVEFADYTPKEMYLIADEIAKKNDYIIDNSCIEPLITYFESKNIKGRNDNGNGRLVRNVVEKAIVNQSNRIVNANDGDLQVLKLVDFELKKKRNSI
ncbi:MAG: AAA family ATPase [Clostridia bacterium]|nr:AAA family ATPase [Clostridia bacterium]